MSNDYSGVCKHCGNYLGLSGRCDCVGTITGNVENVLEMHHGDTGLSFQVLSNGDVYVHGRKILHDPEAVKGFEKIMQNGTVFAGFCDILRALGAKI